MRTLTGTKLMLRFHVTILALCASLTAVANGQEDQAISNLRLAGQKLAEGDLEQAATLAKKTVEQAGDHAGILQRAAEILYRSGNAQDSLPVFDRVCKLDPESAPYNWQRGLALCSCGRWEQGAEQFKTHHDVNPDDVENSAWYFLCIAKTKGLDAARQTVIPSRGDGREPMMSILKMLRGEIEPPAVLVAADKNTSGGTERKRARMYAGLYVGLYYDCLGNAALARKYLAASQTHDYDSYMTDAARVYLEDRFPEPDKAKN